ncbi:MAG: hypothetical protein WHV26_01780 [Spirochaetota bacterium]
MIIILFFIFSFYSQSQALLFYNNFCFLPQAALSLDYSIIESDVGFTAKQVKEVDLQIFWYNTWKVSMYVKENIYTLKRHNATYYPYRISYYMDFAYISYQLPNSQIGITFNHICNNTIDKPQRSIGTELRWYGIGIKWYSNGMQAGYDPTYSYNSPFLSFKNFHYSFYIGYPFLSKVPEYKYMSSAIIRYDIPCFPYGIPFIEIQIDGLVYPDNTLSLNRIIELGCMVPSSAVTFIPYWCYGMVHDSLYPGMTDTYFAFGLKAQSLIGNYYYNDFRDTKHETKTNNTSLHFLAGYAKTMSSEYYNFTTDLAITLQQLISDKNYAYFTSYLNHNSEDQPTALYPRFINISIKSGYAQYIFPYHHLIISYEHYRRHDGNEYRGQTENYHAIEVSMKNHLLLNMLLNSPKSSEFDNSYNTIDYEISVAYIYSQHHYPYFLILKPIVYYYFTCCHSCKPYVGIELLYFMGKENNYEYCIESGMVLNTTIPLSIYYSFKRDIDIDITGGAHDLYHLIGIRLKL